MIVVRHFSSILSRFCSLTAQWNSSQSNQRRLGFETLEDRKMLAVISVDSLLDNTVADGSITLREALIAANQDTVADAVEGIQAGNGSDTIMFASELFTQGSASIVLSAGELLVSTDLEIEGPGDSLLTIDARGNDETPLVFDGMGSRVIHFEGAPGKLLTVAVNGLRITGGDVGAKNIESLGGGGILAEYANLTLSEVDVFANSTRGRYAPSGGGLLGSYSDVRIYDSRIFQNDARYVGGVDIHNGNLEIYRTSIRQNTVYLDGPGGVQVLDSTFRLENSRVSENDDGGVLIGNSSGTVSATAIERNGGNRNSGAAGLRLYSSNVTVESSSVVESGLYGNGTPSGWVPGIWTSGGLLTVVNTTVAKNGIGLLATNGSSVHLAHSTIVHNLTKVSDQSAGIQVLDNSILTASHVVLAENSFGNTAAPDVSEETIGAIEISYSLIENPGNVVISQDNNLVGVNARVGTLASNGGVAKTVPLLMGSPAIDAGHSALPASPAFDQRQSRFVRIFDGNGDGDSRIDLGAFEWQPLPFSEPIVVDSTTDELDGDYSENHLSLREAIGLAQADGSAREILFDSSLSGGSILLELGPLVIAGDISVNASGLSENLTIDGGGDFAVFDPTPWHHYDAESLIVIAELFEDQMANVTLAGLTLTGSVGSSFGAIHSYGNLRLEDSTIVNNAAYFGSAINIVSKDATLTIVNSLIDDNWSTYHGTVMTDWTDVFIYDSIFENNQALRGGALSLKTSTSIQIERTTIRGNTARAGGGSM